MITAKDRKMYVLSRKIDKEMLIYCKQLEGLKLSKGDRETVKLIKSQLRRDWRSPLLKELKQIRRKYKKRF